MTLIVSYLNKYGVVLASDSNLSNKKGNAGFGQKVFPISFLKAGVTYSGLYEIGGQDIDDWLNQFIRNESFITNSIELFVENLCNQLNLEFNGSTGEGV